MTKKQIISKYEPVIDEYLHHRTKAIKRRREIELQKLDAENDRGGLIPIEPGIYERAFNVRMEGEYSKQKARQARYEKWCWRALILLAVVLIGISLFI